MPQPTPSPLDVYLLGRVEFDDLIALQRRLVYDYGERRGGAIVLCETSPIISVGRAGSRAHIEADDEMLRAWGFRLRWVNRGGGCMLHVPGQLSTSLILPLRPLGLDLHRYLGGLNRVILEVLREFDLGALARADAGGVRLGDDRVASLGVAVRRWIAYHGFTLNIGPFMAPFAMVREPGINGATRATSIESRRQRPTPPSRVRESLLRQVEGVFGLERSAIFTDHPLIRRTSPLHVHAHCSL